MKTKPNDPAVGLQEWSYDHAARVFPLRDVRPGMTKREQMALELMSGMMANPAFCKVHGGVVDYTNAKTVLAQVAWCAVIGADILIEHLNYEPGPLRDRGEPQTREEVENDG